MYLINFKINLLQGAKDATINPVKTKGKTMKSTRYIRKFESDFDPKEFAGNEAQKVYIDAHKKLSEYVHSWLKLKKYSLGV